MCYTDYAKLNESLFCKDSLYFLEGVLCPFMQHIIEFDKNADSIRCVV